MDTVIDTLEQKLLVKIEKKIAPILKLSEKYARAKYEIGSLNAQLRAEKSRHMLMIEGLDTTCILLRNEIKDLKESHKEKDLLIESLKISLNEEKSKRNLLAILVNWVFHKKNIS